MTLELIAVGLVVATVLVIGAGVRRTPVRTTRRSTRIDAATRRSGHAAIVDVALTRFRARPVIRPGEVASWCDDVARRVRSGASLSQALVDSVPGDADVRDRDRADPPGDRTRPSRRRSRVGSSPTPSRPAGATATSPQPAR